MNATVYRPLSEEYPTFDEAKLTDIFNIISFDYTKRFYSVGEFTMEIPIDEPAVPFVERDTILVTDTGDSLYIADTEETERTFIIKGYDLKILLAMRLTLFPQEEQDKGTYGYYVVKGSTEICIKDIVAYNIDNAADEERRIYGFTRAGTMSPGKGIAEDRYMTRLEPLDKVAETLCKNAKIGWDVTADIEHNQYVFDVIEPTDRSENQTEVSTMIFSEEFLNVQGFSRKRSVSELKNAIYAINGGGSEPYVQAVNRSEQAASGVYRKETVVNVNCDYDEIEAYALKETEDKIETDVFRMEVSAEETYKKEWFIGDICTFKSERGKLDASIVEVKVSRTADSYRVTIAVGESTATVFGSLSNAVGKNSRDVNNAALSKNNGSCDDCVGKFTNEAKNSEIFNDYENNTANGLFLHTTGQNNKNSGLMGSICGGYENTINGSTANFIGNGHNNAIENCTNSVIVGGENNKLKGNYSVIGGGASNKIEGGFGDNGIFSGRSNTVDGAGWSAISGGQSNKIGDGTSSSAHDFIGAGSGNTVIGSRNAIVSGQANSMLKGNNQTPNDCFIGGGYYNRMIGGLSKSAIVGGHENIIQGSGMCQFIGAGLGCEITADGNMNFIAAGYNVKIKGHGNFFGTSIAPSTITGDNNTVFGRQNEVNHNDTFVAGYNLKPDCDYQTLFGFGNEPTDGKGVFVIAKGRNLLMLDENGNLHLAGNVYTGYSGSGGGDGASAVSAYAAHSDNSPDDGYTGNVEVATGKTLVFENGILKSVI